MNKEPITVCILQENESFKLPKPPDIPEIPEPPEFEEIEFVTFTSNEIRGMSDNELTAILSGESFPSKHLSSSTRTLITTELISRSIDKASRKTHWTTIPTFVIAIILLLFSGISIWPQIKSWFFLIAS